MKKINWKTIYREPKTTISNILHKKYPYLLRNLKTERRNQVWVTDITYIPMAKGFMYLIAIIDLHTRYVVNWSISNSMTADWCAEVLEEAIKKYGKPEIFNTDQGSQFTSDVFINILKDNDILISMDGKGRALDNIFIERLWRTVKYEDIYLKAYKNGLDLYEGLSQYFEFYNEVRFHQSLDYKTPSEIYKLKQVA
jgi:putative transposase